MIETKHLQATLDTSSGVLYQVRYKSNYVDMGAFIKEVDNVWYYQPCERGGLYPGYVLEELGEMLGVLNGNQKDINIRIDNPDSCEYTDDVLKVIYKEIWKDGYGKDY